MTTSAASFGACARALRQRRSNARSSTRTRLQRAEQQRGRRGGCSEHECSCGGETQLRRLSHSRGLRGDRTEKAARHHARELEVVIRAHVCAVEQQVMRRLQSKAFLNLGEGRQSHMRRHDQQQHVVRPHSGRTAWEERAAEDGA